MLYQLSYFRISSYLSGHLLRWTSYRQSVIYSSKLPSSSLVRLESDRSYTPVFSFISGDFRFGLRLKCGRRWIRTTEGINQQIYSLPHLATLVFSLYFRFREPMEGIEPTTPRLQITCSSQLSYIGDFVV